MPRQLAAILVLALAVPAAAQAVPAAFALRYVGVGGSAATATGSIVFDDVTPRIDGWAFAPAAERGIARFSLTVSGASAGNGRFDLDDFAGNPHAPTGSMPFEITADGRTADVLVLASMVPVAVPEPASAGLLALGAAALAALARRRAQRRAASQPRTLACSADSGTAPVASTWRWKSRGSKRAPSAASASARSPWIACAPTW